MRKRGRLLWAIVTVILTMSVLAGPALAQESGGSPLGDLLSAVNELVGTTKVESGAAVRAVTPDAELGAAATYKMNQSGLNSLLGGLLGGSYKTSAALKGPNNLSAYASTGGDYGLASAVRGLAAGLAGLLGGLTGGQ